MLSMIERVRQLEFLWILGAKYPRVHSRQVCELKELEHTSYPMHQFRASLTKHEKACKVTSYHKHLFLQLWQNLKMSL
ncbi:uncharacterized protein [Physcomitrium patens]|uniref:uncharacterized protein isoform X3 n=1 Tax=Physcomitrium patens TaxID=3218 RepID=UPI003CCE24A7